MNEGSFGERKWEDTEKERFIIIFSGKLKNKLVKSRDSDIDEEGIYAMCMRVEDTCKHWPLALLSFTYTLFLFFVSLLIKV